MYVIYQILKILRKMGGGSLAKLAVSYVVEGVLKIALT